jgi:hypothetical protein
LRVVASVTYFSPTEREGQQPQKEGQERRLRRERKKGLHEGGESLKLKMLQME